MQEAVLTKSACFCVPKDELCSQGAGHWQATSNSIGTRYILLRMKESKHGLLLAKSLLFHEQEEEKENKIAMQEEVQVLMESFTSKFFF